MPKNIIKEIIDLWEINNFKLSYQQLIEGINLQTIDLVLVAKTNPAFEDDVIIQLFGKYQ